MILWIVMNLLTGAYALLSYDCSSATFTVNSTSDEPITYINCDNNTVRPVIVFEACTQANKTVSLKNNGTTKNITLECVMSSYIQNVTSSNISLQGSASMTPVPMDTYSTPPPLTGIKLLLTKNGSNINSSDVVSLGDEIQLEVHFSASFSGKIKPTQCWANSNSEDYKIWDENCNFDANLIGGTWTFHKDAHMLTNTIHAFRFRDDVTIHISCDFRVCPLQSNKQCDLNDCPKQSHRKLTYLSNMEENRYITLSSSFTVNHSDHNDTDQ